MRYKEFMKESVEGTTYRRGHSDFNPYNSERECPECGGDGVIRHGKFGIDRHDNSALIPTGEEECPVCHGEGLVSESGGDEYDDMEWGTTGPHDDDGFIQDNTRGGYDASVDGKFIGNFGDVDEAYHAIRSAAGPNYFPTVWFIDDHGGIEEFKDDTKLMASRGPRPKAQQRIQKHKLR